MKAREMPRLRQQVIAHLDSPTTRAMFEASRGHPDQWFGGVNESPQMRNAAEAISKDPHVARQDEITRWRLAELFYVTEPMTRLTIAAAESLRIEDLTLTASDLPAPVGVLHFDGPPIDDSPGRVAARRTYLTTISWCVVGDVVWVSWWADWSRNLHDRTPQVQAVFKRLLAESPIGYDDETLWKFGTPWEVQPGQESWMRRYYRLRAAWLLMQQPVASVIRPTLSEADRAQGRRLGYRPSDVRIVTLRHAAPDSPGASGHDAVHHDHRWLVRGHWRRQFYPSQHRNIPIWIQPHVKGPDGAPLRTIERVNQWSR